MSGLSLHESCIGFYICCKFIWATFQSPRKNSIYLWSSNLLGFFLSRLSSTIVPEPWKERNPVGRSTTCGSQFTTFVLRIQLGSGLEVSAISSKDDKLYRESRGRCLLPPGNSPSLQPQQKTEAIKRPFSCQCGKNPGAPASHGGGIQVSEDQSGAELGYLRKSFLSVAKR